MKKERKIANKAIQEGGQTLEWNIKRIITITGIVMLFVIVSVATRSDAEETIRITSGEWQPYTSEQMPHYGQVSQIVTEAFALEGVRVEYGFFPWKRSVNTAKDGDWDGTVALARTPERDSVF